MQYVFARQVVRRRNNDAAYPLGCFQFVFQRRAARRTYPRVRSARSGKGRIGRIYDYINSHFQNVVAHDFKRHIIGQPCGLNVGFRKQAGYSVAGFVDFRLGDCERRHQTNGVTLGVIQ